MTAKLSKIKIFQLSFGAFKSSVNCYDLMDVANPFEDISHEVHGSPAHQTLAALLSGSAIDHAL